MKIGIAASAIMGLAAMGTCYSLFGQSSTSRSVWDGVYTADQANRGRALFGQECAVCHGDSLTGADEAPALIGGAFLANWDGLTVGDLFERIRISMPANSPGKLNREKVADILSYLLAMNRFPAGNSELDRRTEVLKEIRIEATKPDQKK
ncbi:MAG TPA: cytochrome c [Bryobacteraceae bacterium]|nr:cytochrome c [Bryobacteraceae bacterium]